ncbi:MAG: FAD-dependent oxidoreductase [Ignavibacteriae bacterium]|nr:FAD-dependent oxidoreductase [Ignavibacteriota bacterium]
MPTRREFLQKSALATAGAFLARTAHSAAMPDRPRVIVLGAGLAGLAAAYALTKEQCELVVLEARNRIGGRVLSHDIDSGKKLTVELGAEWVGNSHERVIALCKEFGLELFNNQFETHLIYKNEYFPQGRWNFSESWNTTYAKLLAGFEHFSDVQKRTLDKMDWWRYLMNNGIAERDLDLRELADSTDFGESIRHVSGYAAMTEYAESSPKNEMDLKIRGGNSRLPEALAAKVGRDRIKLQHKVAAIKQEAKEMTVTCENGASFTGDFVICTLPTFALSKIEWLPALSGEKVEAINALQYCRINKHAVLFNERFWKDEAFDLLTDSNAHYFYHATKSQKSGQGVLISYSVGDKADVLARQNNAYRKRIIVDALRRGFGDLSRRFVRQVNYYWGNDPHSMGAYAIYGKNQWFTLQPILAKPHERVFFAGEHLADWQGFMEGAVVTGEDAARGVLEF